MAETTPPVELEHLSVKEVRERIGELVSISLRQRGACVLVARRTGELTVINPDILDAVPLEDLAAALLGSWTEAEIAAFLEASDKRRNSS